MNRKTLSASSSPNSGHCSHPILLALCISTTLGLFTPEVLAQESATTINAELRTYNIPAQPLSEALLQFGEQSGLQITTDSNLLKDKQSTAISGAKNVQQALTQLLMGTGLQYQITDRMVSLKATGDATTLPPVTISANASETTSEESGKYNVASTSTATRLNLSPRETPQTITVVTHQQIEDFELTDVDEVLESASGVFVYNRGPNGSEYFSRGFALQSQYDGMINPLGISQSNIAPSPDSATLDHVEIIQGASGLLTGAGDPGGVVNMVRKMPTRDFQSSVSASGGSWDYVRLEGDVSGPLNESGSVRGRLVGAYQDNDTHVDFEHHNKNVVYGVLEADVTSTTNLMASVQYQDWDYNKHYGVPRAPDGRDLDFKRSSFFGIAGDDNLQKSNLLLTTGITQKLMNNWQFKTTYLRSENDVDIISNYLIGLLDADTGDGLTSMALGLQRELSSDTLDLHLKGPFTLFGNEHEAFVGFNGSERKERFRNAINPQTINAYDYDPHSISAPDDLGDWGDEETTRQYGYYLGGRFSISERLTTILGSRLSWYKDELTEEDSVYSPYAGVIYDLSDQLSVYASYSDIFSPQSNRNSSGIPLDPVVGSNYEVGTKGEFFDGALNSTIAVFRLEQTNLPELDESIPFDENNICGGSCYDATSEVVSEGIDISVSGVTLAGIHLNASYTYQESEHSEGSEKGDKFNTLQPRHTLRLTGKYSLPGDKWTLGAEAKFLSKIYEQGTYRDVEYRTEENSVTLLDLMVQYQINPNSSIKLRAENVFDKKYFESVGSTRLYNIYGAPRGFYLSYNLAL